MKKIMTSFVFIGCFLLARSAYCAHELHAAVRSNDLAAVLSVLTLNASLVNDQDDEECTPLHCVTTLLVMHPAHLEVLDAVEMEECMAQIFNCEREDRAWQLFLAGVVGKLGIDDEKAQRFLWAMRLVWNRAQIIKALLARGARIDALDKHGHTILHFAARGLPLCLVRFLLRQPHIESVMKKKMGMAENRLLLITPAGQLCMPQ